MFFNLNAESLSADLKDISEWQGGDIVIFKNHIAIVSDRRNQHGVPYVIHHANPLQKNYEEDILENMMILEDIIDGIMDLLIDFIDKRNVV